MIFKRSTKSSSAGSNSTSEVAVTLIAHGTECNGNLTTDGEVQVAGLVRGSIDSSACFVAADGVVSGEVSADQVVVCGRVTGPLRAYHVHLQRGAQVDGDVISSTIAIDSGAVLNGSVQRVEDPFAGRAGEPPSQVEKERSSYLDNPLWSGSGNESKVPSLSVVRPGKASG